MRTDDEDIFRKDSLDFGKLGLLGHAINTGDCKPVKQPPCRVPPYQREFINQQLEELLATGRIINSLKVLGTVQWYLLRNKMVHTVCALNTVNLNL